MAWGDLDSHMRLILVGSGQARRAQKPEEEPEKFREAQFPRAFSLAKAGPSEEV